MATKTLENLTQSELEIVQEFVDAFGITPEEALQASIAEGAISESGGTHKFAPDGFKELKFYVVNNKSHYYKINRQLKKDKKAEMFTEDCFYYDTVITKSDDGYDLEKCSTNDVGEKPRVIILSNYFKAKRSNFDGTGKGDKFNLETTLAKSTSFADQEKMLVSNGWGKGKNVKTLRDEIKNHKGEIPDETKHKFSPIKFRVITFGLVEVNGEWKRFYFESASRFDDENKTTYFFDKDIKSVIKSNFLCTLEQTKQDENGNAVIQIMVDGKAPDELLSVLKPEINSARADMLDYISSSYESAKSEGTNGATPAKAKPEDDEGEVEQDPFED